MIFVKIFRFIYNNVWRLKLCRQNFILLWNFWHLYVNMLRFQMSKLCQIFVKSSKLCIFISWTKQDIFKTDIFFKPTRKFITKAANQNPKMHPWIFIHIFSPPRFLLFTLVKARKLVLLEFFHSRMTPHVEWCANKYSSRKYTKHAASLRHRWNKQLR